MAPDGRLLSDVPLDLGLRSSRWFWRPFGPRTSALLRLLAPRGSSTPMASAPRGNPGQAHLPGAGTATALLVVFLSVSSSV